jgi:hypothetical protein
MVEKGTDFYLSGIRIHIIGTVEELIMPPRNEYKVLTEG